MLLNDTKKPAQAFNPLAISEWASYGIICVDKHWRIRSCNEEMESLLGYPTGGLLGLRLFESCAIFQQPALFDTLQQAINGLDPVVQQAYFPGPGRWLEISASYAKGQLIIYFRSPDAENEGTSKPALANIQLAGGTLSAVNPVVDPFESHHSTSDMPAEGASKAGLTDPAEVYLLLFENAPLPKWIYHSQTLNIIDVNAAALQQYGYSRDEFLSMSVLDICTPNDRRILAARVASGQVLTGEWTHKTKAGNDIIVDIVTTCLEYRHKNVCLATINNITERKTLEIELKDSQEKLSNILENIGDGFLTVDKSWTIRFLNRKAEIFLGNARSFFLGKYFWDVFHDAIHSRFYVEYNRAMTQNLPVHFEEYYPGLEAWFEISAYPSGEGLSIFFQNITDKVLKQKEEKQNSEKLCQAETNLQRVLESMSDGFYTLDQDWNITYATDKVACMLGINKKDYVGRNLWTSLPEAVHTAFFPEFHKARFEGKAVRFEEYLSTFNMWFEVNAYPHDDILSVYVKNITPRKNDEKRLTFIARATSEVIWERDLDSDTAYINSEKFYTVFGYSLDANTISMSFWQSIVHPDDLPAITENSNAAIENDLDNYMHEYRLKKANGTWSFVKDRVHIIKDEENRPVRKIGAIEDVTSERQAEKALQESEQTYKELFDYASLPKAIYDRESLRILKVNKAAIEHYGYSREEFLNMTILDLRPKEDHLKIRKLVATPELNSRTNLGVWTHTKKNGQKILCDVSISTIVYENKVCNMAVVMDVTEKLKLQEQLTKEKIEKQKSITRTTLEVQERERSVIGRDLHDGVNQMLTAAKLYAENIKFYPAQSAHFVDKTVTLLQKSINEIRVLSKALVTPTITDIGFKEALLEMIEGYKDLRVFEIHHLICEESAAIEQNVKLTIYRIIQEQLNNIIKHANASQVSVHVILAAGELLVIVEDNGAGFDLSQKKSGIGLKNIQHRAEIFKGKVKIQSAPAYGCKLEVSFPLHSKQIQNSTI